MSTPTKMIKTYTIQAARRAKSASSSTSCGPVQFYVYGNGELITKFSTRSKAEAFIAAATVANARAEALAHLARSK
jgi:hypothetical protein